MKIISSKKLMQEFIDVSFEVQRLSKMVNRTHEVTDEELTQWMIDVYSTSTKLANTVKSVIDSVNVVNQDTSVKDGVE